MLISFVPSEATLVGRLRTECSGVQFFFDLLVVVGYRGATVNVSTINWYPKTFSLPLFQTLASKRDQKEGFVVLQG
jgi:hypothetical protein